MISLPNPLSQAAIARPQHPALVVVDGPTLCWAELRAEVAGRAAALARRGVASGQVHALLGEPSAAFIANLWALSWLGAVPALLPWRAPKAELDRALRALNPAGLWVDPAHPEAARGGWPDPEEAQSEAVDWPLDAPRLIVLSSGTTGPPRPVPLSAAQLAFSAFGSAMRLGHDPADRWLCPLPLHHVGGLSILLRTTWAATTTVLMPRFDAARASALLDEVQLASLVPSMLADILDARRDRPFAPTLRAILIGGAQTPPGLVDRCRAIGAPVALSWGMSETGSQVATRFPGDLSPGGHVGPPLPFARVSPGASGALSIEGPVAPRGRFLTRDLGHIDPQGRVVVSGRAEDLILSGGENIDPAEVEAALCEHPAVREAAVVGRPDPRWGERPVAFVVLDAPIDAAALTAHCRTQLASFKVPDQFVVIERLPRGELGKLSRAALRDQAQRAQGVQE